MDHKRNLLYFEAPSMRELYNCMEAWQTDNRKRLLSVSVEQDNGQFCCIALANPSEVVITDIHGNPAVVEKAYNVGYASVVTEGR